MITKGAHRIGWRPRSTPLVATAVLARGKVVAPLIARVLGRFDESRALEGVVGPGLVVLIGPELPWVDGARYFGKDRDAPYLFLPTTMEPDVSVHLLASALPPTLLLVDPDADELVPLEGALPISAEKLRAVAAR